MPCGPEARHVPTFESVSHRFLLPFESARSATNTLLPLRNLAQTSVMPPSIITIWPVM
jgi:hypothetical protein